MEYIDYCSKCDLAFTSQCKPNSRDCIAERNKILSNIKNNHIDYKTENIFDVLKSKNDELQTINTELSKLLKLALEALNNNNACTKDCKSCINSNDCNSWKVYQWKFTGRAKGFILENDIKNKNAE